MAVFRLRKSAGGSTVRGGDGIQSLVLTITGSLLTRSPSFPTGSVNPGNVTVTGVLLARSPAFPTGTVTSAITVTGSLLSRSPTFPTGAVNATNTITGLLLTRSPTFPVGAVTLLVVIVIPPAFVGKGVGSSSLRLAGGTGRLVQRGTDRPW